MKQALTLAVSIFVLSSCVTQGLYDWGNYEDALFDYYHQPETKDEMLLELIAHLEDQEAKGATPAPGLFAEVGTFYFLEGEVGSAIAFYQKESEYWPESRDVMNRLIKNLEANR